MVFPSLRLFDWGGEGGWHVFSGYVYCLPPRVHVIISQIIVVIIVYKPNFLHHHGGWKNTIHLLTFGISFLKKKMSWKDGEQIVANPGTWNWMSTSGHTTALMQFKEYLPPLNFISQKEMQQNHTAWQSSYCRQTQNSQANLYKGWRVHLLRTHSLQ